MKPLIHIADEYALISASYVASVRFTFADRTHSLRLVFGIGKIRSIKYVSQFLSAHGGSANGNLNCLTLSLCKRHCRHKVTCTAYIQKLIFVKEVNIELSA